MHASLDGVAVISHDPDLSRVAGRDVRIGQLTMDELREVRLGNDQGFASLAEALGAFPEALFNIDVKSADAVGPTIAAVLAAGATSRVLITSFSARRRLATMAGLRDVATSASAPAFLVALVAAAVGLHPIVRRALRSVDAVQVPVKALGLRVASPRIIRAFHRAGVEVHFWTINDAADMDRLLDLGADGLVTDRADLAIAVVEKRSANRM